MVMIKSVTTLIIIIICAMDKYSVIHSHINSVIMKQKLNIGVIFDNSSMEERWCKKKVFIFQFLNRFKVIYFMHYA